MTDHPVLQRINEQVSREHQMLTHKSTSEEERVLLRNLQIELDQCWDLLRQRRAWRTTAQNVDHAQTRLPEVVEQYEQ